MADDSFELADVLRTGFGRYAAEHGPLPGHYYKVVNALLSCHTSALGGHVYRCEQCGHEKVSYNSCRNRHCPSCQAAARVEWVDNRSSELLPVPYFHVVFTIPDSLNPFVLRNKEVCYDILFRAASETLHELAAEPRFLGAHIGFFAILHTWGQNLMDHPHLHFVVPSGGVSPDGQRWKKPPYGKFLFPVKVMSSLFKGKFLDYFTAAVKNKEILFHGSLAAFALDPARYRGLVDSLYNMNWVVYAKAPFAGPEAVVRYLGRYTHRIAIANSRLASLTETQVAFRWKDYADSSKNKVMTLTHDEFIRRFLLHVLPHGFVRIRYFGFLGQAVKGKALALCMKLLGVKPKQPLVHDIDRKAWAKFLEELNGKDRSLCPLCNKGRLVCHREIKRPQQNGILSAVA